MLPAWRPCCIICMEPLRDGATRGMLLSHAFAFGLCGVDCGCQNVWVGACRFLFLFHFKKINAVLGSPDHLEHLHHMARNSGSRYPRPILSMVVEKNIVGTIGDWQKWVKFCFNGIHLLSHLCRYLLYP